MNQLAEVINKYKLECNGEGYYNYDNFENNYDDPCYIPENAEDMNDVYSRNKIKQEVIEWLSNDITQEYLLEAYDGVMPVIDETFINEWIESVYENITWEFPSTYLESLTN
jgi:hypothetical protein